MLEDNSFFEVNIHDVGRDRSIGGLSSLANEILKYIESYDKNATDELQPLSSYPTHPGASRAATIPAPIRANRTTIVFTYCVANNPLLLPDLIPWLI